MRNTLYKILITAVVMISSARMVSGQQLPLYSQYLYNKFMINPAAAGSEGYTSFNLTAREQWAGYSGAPRTYSLAWQTRLMKKGYRLKKNIFNNKNTYVAKTDGRVGLGSYIFSDRNGYVERTGFQFSYSYNFWVQDYTQLSLGLGLTGFHYIINVDETNFENPDEPWLNDNLRRGVFIPDASFGIYLLNYRYSLGFSADQMFASSGKLGDAAYDHLRIDRHYYLFGAYTLFADSKIELEPSTLLKMSEQVLPQADIGLTAIYDQKIWTGLAYRTGGGGALIASVRVSYANLYMGYAFDFTLNEIQHVTNGTHEIVLALKLGSNSKRYRWLDRY